MLSHCMDKICLRVKIIYAKSNNFEEDCVNLLSLDVWLDGATIFLVVFSLVIITACNSQTKIRSACGIVISIPLHC